MRILCGILFLGGCFFAILAWICVLSPLGIFQPENRYGVADTILSLTGSALAASGYLIWFCWGAVTLGYRFSRIALTRLWLISLVNHCGWVAWFPFFRHTSLAEFAFNLWPVFAWLVINLAIAARCLIILQSEDDRR